MTMPAGALDMQQAQAELGRTVGAPFYLDTVDSYALSLQPGFGPNSGQPIQMSQWRSRTCQCYRVTIGTVNNVQYGYNNGGFGALVPFTGTTNAKFSSTWTIINTAVGLSAFGRPYLSIGSGPEPTPPAAASGLFHNVVWRSGNQSIDAALSGAVALPASSGLWTVTGVNTKTYEWGTNVGFSWNSLVGSFSYVQWMS